MNWYHAADGQQAGPFTEEQFRELIAKGIVQRSTLVWEVRLPNWLPLSQVPEEILPRPATEPAAAFPGGPPVIGGIPGATGGVVCAECGGSFPTDQVIHIADRNVCAACKPVFMQKLREGSVSTTSPVPGTPRYAGFWIRLLAKFLDGLIVGIPLMILYFIGSAIFGFSMVSTTAGAQPNFGMIFASIGLQLALQVGSLVVGGAYNVFFLYKYSATPGKMAVGLRVFMADGRKLSLGRTIGRYFAEMLSGLTCYIGYIMVGFDAEKRSLHDHICNTRVVYK